MSYVLERSHKRKGRFKWSLPPPPSRTSSVCGRWNSLATDSLKKMKSSENVPLPNCGCVRLKTEELQKNRSLEKERKNKNSDTLWEWYSDPETDPKWLMQDDVTFQLLQTLPKDGGIQMSGPQQKTHSCM